MREHTPRPQRHCVNLFVSSGDEMLPFGRTRDLSVTGIFVETTTRPAIDSIVNIGLVWGDDSLVCAARVARHASEGIGLHFVNPDTFFLRAITEILESSPAVEVVVGF